MELRGDLGDQRKGTDHMCKVHFRLTVRPGCRCLPLEDNFPRTVFPLSGAAELLGVMAVDTGMQVGHCDIHSQDGCVNKWMLISTG